MQLIRPLPPSIPPFPPSPFLPSRSTPFHLEVAPIAARESRERLSSPSGSGRSLATKRFLVHFELKIVPQVTMVLRRFLANQFKYKLFYSC